MEEKEPVVIQGRTIRRERQAERPASDRYAYTGSVKTRNRPDRYSLSALRENRRLRGVQNAIRRTGTGDGRTAMHIAGITFRRSFHRQPPTAKTVGSDFKTFFDD